MDRQWKPVAPLYTEVRTFRLYINVKMTCVVHVFLSSILVASGKISKISHPWVNFAIEFLSTRPDESPTTALSWKRWDGHA